MRTPVLALGIVLLGCDIARADAAPQRLRSDDAHIRRVIQEGLRRSPTFARLVQVVEGSDFFVYVQRLPALSNGMRGCLLHGGTDRHYLRVLLKRGMSVDHTIQVLAHELQHVREVIDAGALNTPAALDALFDRIGDARIADDKREQYETTAALEITSLVARELRSTGSRSAP